MHEEGSLLYLCKLVLYSYNVSLSHANEVLRVWGKPALTGTCLSSLQSYSVFYWTLPWILVHRVMDFFLIHFPKRRKGLPRILAEIHYLELVLTYGLVAKSDRWYGDIQLTLKPCSNNLSLWLSPDSNPCFLSWLRSHPKYLELLEVRSQSLSPRGHHSPLPWSVLSARYNIQSSQKIVSVRDSLDLAKLWLCLQEIILIMIIDVGRPCHCGWLHSLGIWNSITDKYCYLLLAVGVLRPSLSRSSYLDFLGNEP